MPDHDTADQIRERFEQLCDCEHLPAELSIVQYGSCWRSDAVTRRLAGRLDLRLFQSFLLGEAMHVRRIVLYDIPSDEGGTPERYQDANKNHVKWIRSLIRDLYYLGMPQQQLGAPYRLKHLVLGRIDFETSDWLADDWADGSPSDWQSAFEEEWHRPGCIENNLQPAEFPVGPRGDRDFRRYLWQ